MGAEQENSIGKRIRQAREALKMAQTTLGERLGVSYQTVQHWEAGRATPGRRKWPKLAQVLQVREEWILTGSGGTAPERQRLHDLVDRLPERHLASAELFLMAMINDPDPTNGAHTGAQPPAAKR